MERRKQTLNLIPKHKIGMEIGTWKGEFAYHLLNTCNPTKLYLVDPWLFQPNSEDNKESYTNRWYGGSQAKSQQDMDSIYQNVCKIFRNDSRIHILRCKSSDIDIEKNSIDWVYIDGNHSYDFVYKDLKISFDLLKDDGYIIGDDYNNSDEVKGAVDRYVKENKNAIMEFFLIEGQYIIKLKK